MRAHRWPSILVCVGAAGVLSAAALIPPSPQQEPVHEVALAAAPTLGAIPFAFIRNQFEYCSVICPFALQGAVTVPLAAAQTPVTFFNALASTGSVLRAAGTAAASVTGPANAAVDPIITNDLSLVLPKAQHALNVSIVEAINVGATLRSPGEVLQAVQTARSRILGALNESMGPPRTPTGASNILQVVAVESVNVASAVVFQAGELALLGVVQTADATAQELARSGDPAAAVAAGAAQARRAAGAATARVTTAVDTALTNVRNSLDDSPPKSTLRKRDTVEEADDTEGTAADANQASDDRGSAGTGDTKADSVSDQSNEGSSTSSGSAA